MAVGVQDRPAAAPQDGIWVSDYELFKKPSFLEAISAVSSMVFAYAGTSGFFAIAAEMREPEHYTRALVVCQSVVTGTYLSIGIVLYYFCGSYVASPALGSAGPLMKKVSYGIGIPGILVSTVIVCHVRLLPIAPPPPTHTHTHTHTTVLMLFFLLVAEQVYLRPSLTWYRTFGR